MGRRREVSIISHRPVTRRDLKQERSFFVGVSQRNIFATGGRLGVLYTISEGELNRKLGWKIKRLRSNKTKTNNLQE